LAIVTTLDFSWIFCVIIAIMMAKEARSLIGQWRQVRANALICAAAAALLILPIMIGDRILARWDLAAGDLLTDNRGGGTVDERLVLIGIDDASLDIFDVLGGEDIEASPALGLMVDGYPFPRSVYALLAQKLLDAGARLVVFDMLFIGDSEEAGEDEALKQVIAANPGRVVIGCTFLESEVSEANVVAEHDRFVLPAGSVLESDGPMDPRVGFVNFYPEIDARVRAMRPVMRAYPHLGSPLRHSLAMAALKQLGLGARIEEPGADYFMRFPNFRRVAEPPYAPLPFYTLFVDHDWQTNYKGGESFRDKIVYVGGTSVGRFHDEVTIPEDTIQGAQLQMVALAAALNGDFYTPPGEFRQILAVLVMAFGAFGLAFIMRRPILGLLILAAGALLYLLAARGIYFSYSALLPTVAPVMTLGLAGIGCFGNRFAQELLEKARLRRTLERQVSKELADHILSMPEDYFQSLPGVRKPVVVLFSDIRSFTARSEKDDPVKLVAQLREYLDAMGKVVFAHGGVVDKFIGDAVMAVWGNLRSAGAEQDARSAVAAAVAMQHKLRELNAKWAAEGREPFKIGIGLNCGDAIFGMMGSEQKQEMTVIGDPVNQAARFEGLTKKFGLDIIIGVHIAERIGGEFELRSLGKIRTLGKDEAEELSAVLGGEDDAVAAGRADWLRRYHEALGAFSRGELEIAREGFRACAAEHPDDATAVMYLDAIARGATGGVLTMTEK